METPKLSVEAIEKGTVIDHIPAGKGLIILRQFKLLHYGSAVTVGFNLPSKTQGSKDIIKITGVWLDDNAANRFVAGKLLEMFGCTAEMAENGREAVSGESFRDDAPTTAGEAAAIILDGVPDGYKATDFLAKPADPVEVDHPGMRPRPVSHQIARGGPQIDGKPKALVDQRRAVDQRIGTVQRHQLGVVQDRLPAPQAQLVQPHARAHQHRKAARADFRI